MPDTRCDALDILACPIDGTAVVQHGEEIVCARGHRFPVVQGVPVMLRDDVSHTIGIAGKSLEMARAWAEGRRDDPMFVDTLGVTEGEREQVRAQIAAGEATVDPVVSHLVAATNGMLYEGLRGRLDRIPIPSLRLPIGNGERLLDIGCNWGRWSLAAAEKGYRPVGIEPSLGAVLAARRLARQRGLAIETVVADARFLPIRTASVGAAFSYSVLQHFSKADARRAFQQIARAVRPGGLIRIQMASAIGVRSFQHMARRGFREPEAFDVRYWTPSALIAEFRRLCRDGRLEVDCYFGLGLQPTDRSLYGRLGKAVLDASEALRKASRVVTPLTYVADSLYLVGHNDGVAEAGEAQSA